MMKTSGSIDMSFPPAGIHTPAKSDFNNSCMNLTCPPSSLFFCACAKTLSRACMYTPACAQTHAFASSLPFNAKPETLESVYCCAAGKPTNLSVPDLL